MSDDADTHPLDRDYSEPLAEPIVSTPFHRGLRKAGFGAVAGGFALLIPAAILLGDPQTVGPYESIGNRIRQFGMLMILGGGISVVLAYRIPAVQSKNSGDRRASRVRSIGSFGWLLGANVIVFGVIVALISAIQWGGTPVVFLLTLNAILAITVSLMVTIAIYHRGMMRGFAIGIIAAMLLNVLMMFNGLGRLWGRDASMFFIGSLAIIQISGLVSAGYVVLSGHATPSSTES